MLKQIWALLFVLLLPLSACGPMYETQYTMVPPKTAEGRMCVMNCQQGRNLCRQSCKIDEQSCRAEARARAAEDYRAYVHAQQVEKKPIKKSPRDFEYAYGCGTSSCERECDTDHRQCYTSCGGQVISRRVCTSSCDQVSAKESASTATRSAPMSTPSMGPATGKSASAYAPLCQPGQRVEAYSDGEWYEATVKAPARSNGRCPVHFEGYDDEDDEDVLPRNLRPLE